MTHDELAVLNALRDFAPGERVLRPTLLEKTRLSAERLDKALDGLDRSGHIWLEGDKIRTGSDGKTYNT
jgi:hypothetical protein